MKRREKIKLIFGGAIDGFLLSVRGSFFYVKAPSVQKAKSILRNELKLLDEACKNAKRPNFKLKKRGAK